MSGSAVFVGITERSALSNTDASLVQPTLASGKRIKAAYKLLSYADDKIR